jgi:PTS system fructose-specific IIC component
MINIASTLLPADVLLDPPVTTAAEAVRKVAALLQDDERVLDWDEFYEAMIARSPCKVDDGVEYGICIPHARTDVCTEMVLSAARTAQGLSFEDCTKPVRYIFCIGVPKAMASDYLRIAGALMRIFKDPAAEERLRRARTPGEFVDELSALERKL